MGEKPNQKLEGSQAVGSNPFRKVEKVESVRGVRVCVRELRLEDVDQMQNWAEHEDPLFFYYNFPKISQKERQQWYQMKTRWLIRKSYAIENEHGRVIGYLSIRNINWIKRESELGIVLDPAYINQGYGSEALWVFLGHYFETLKMQSLKLRTAKFNKRAIRCYQRCGFRIIKETEEEFEDQYSEIFYQPEYQHLKKLFTEKRGKKMTKYLHMKITRKEYAQLVNSFSTKNMQNCE